MGGSVHSNMRMEVEQQDRAGCGQGRAAETGVWICMQACAAGRREQGDWRWRPPPGTEALPADLLPDHLAQRDGVHKDEVIVLPAEARVQFLLHNEDDVGWGDVGALGRRRQGGRGTRWTGCPVGNFLPLLTSRALTAQWED